jgi:2-polyprenyl-3-methyl-5-hydroxy-6-metoxy-1,4-benzoquinol methylase
MKKVSAPANANWSRARIEELLRSEAFNYQAIGLPYGLTTGGHDRSSTADAILPDDMSEQSFLDVGCSLGYFCFEARRRGAGRVVGMDLDSDNVRKGRILADILGQPVDFRLGDIESAPIGGHFDQVICLNVLHHLANPILGLDRLIAATNRTLVLELATFGAHDRRKLGMNWLQQRLLSRLPALVVEHGTADEGVKQFYITERAIENLLRYRRGCFASVEIVPSPFKERFLVVAQKRRIGRLMVVSGPTCSEMEAVIKHLLDRKVPQVEGFLGVDGVGRWAAPVLFADRYHEPQIPHQNELIFDYDFMRPFSNGAGTFAHDPALDVLETAESTATVTVWMPPERLVMNTQNALSSASGRSHKRLARLLGEYSDPTRLIAHYRAWFKYVTGKNSVHRVLLMKDGTATLMTVKQWERTIAQPMLEI